MLNGYAKLQRKGSKVIETAINSMLRRFLLIFLNFIIKKQEKLLRDLVSGRIMAQRMPLTKAFHPSPVGNCPQHPAIHC